MSRPDLTEARAVRLALRAVEPFENGYPDFVEPEPVDLRAVRRERKAFAGRYEVERFVESRLAS